jgi:hypothetical protein
MSIGAQTILSKWIGIKGLNKMQIKPRQITVLLSPSLLNIKIPKIGGIPPLVSLVFSTM